MPRCRGVTGGCGSMACICGGMAPECKGKTGWSRKPLPCGGMNGACRGMAPDCEGMTGRPCREGYGTLPPAHCRAWLGRCCCRGSHGCMACARCACVSSELRSRAAPLAQAASPKLPEDMKAGVHRNRIQDERSPSGSEHTYAAVRRHSSPVPVPIGAGWKSASHGSGFSCG